MSMTSPPFTIPAAQKQQTTENLNYPIDTSANLAEGESPTDISVTLFNETAGESVELVDSPIPFENFITQRVEGSALERNSIYFLKCTYTGSESGETFSDLVKIICPPY